MFKNSQLSKDFTIEFLGERHGKMTTGSFLPKKNLIKILSRERMLADILRTLSHEWAHAYDHEKIKIKDRKDIGGESENYANSKSGEFTKMFIRKNKSNEKDIFN